MLVLPLVICGCDSRKSPSIGKPSQPIFNADQVVIIEKFCGHCHASPRPDSFARHEWRAEVAQGFRFYEAAEGLSLVVPDQETVVAYYESLAPITIPRPTPAEVESQSLFHAVKLSNVETAEAVSSMVSDGETQSIFCSDMRTGAILSWSLSEGSREVARPVEFSNPCRLTMVDLKNDGRREMLVSDLGSFFPEDHQKGSIWKLDAETGWQAARILQGISRVCDVQASDFDLDGDIDLVVAEFGWRRTGRLLLLWNDSEITPDSWRLEVLDRRHGAIDVPIADVNADGLPDIVAVISQEFEEVVCYLNQGEGVFRPELVFAAGDPSFGSSGIQLVDFDRDGDIDVVHTNGDSFDSSYVKPFHGVRWLENKGTFPFEVHEIVKMPGVHDVAVGDIDLDGDLDMAAVSLLPPSVLSTQKNLPSVIWLEQLSSGGFQQHVVENGESHHAACILSDQDLDGDLDIATSNFFWNEGDAPAIVYFSNATKHSPE